MPTYTWKINRLFTIPQEAGYVDVVVAAMWNLLGEEAPYKANIGGTSQFTVQQGEGFTPYNQLTEAQVIDWVKNSIGQENVARMEARIAEKINEQKNPAPTPTPQPLPWG